MILSGAGQKRTPGGGEKDAGAAFGRSCFRLPAKGGATVKKIDRENWPRREIFEFFSPLSNPFYSVTFRLDVTNVYRFCKRRGLSFYYTLIFLVMRAVNETEAFLYTLRNGEIFHNFFYHIFSNS